MRAVMICDREAIGGAAVAARRLADSMGRTGADITLVAGYPDGQEHSWSTTVLMPLREEAASMGIGRLSRRLNMRRLRSVVRRQLDGLLERIDPDVVNIHNLHGAGWGPELVSLCARHAPTVWTLHDMWSFTGHCAYSYDCLNFITGCDSSCPAPGEYPALERNLIRDAWNLRRHLLAELTDMVAVSPSSWLAKQAEVGLWRGHRVEVIPYGLPLDVYVPLDRLLAQAALGIDSNAPALLVAARRIDIPRKGTAILIEALRKVRTRPLTLIALGQGPVSVPIDGITVHSLGYVDHERTKVLAYNAADLLIHPALADNSPNVIIEAMGCGTPCVGFDIGGVAGIVRPGVTGWVAQDVTADALANAIEDALAAIKQGRDVRTSCRMAAEAQYAADIQAQRYLELFESVRAGRHGAQSQRLRQ